MRWIFHLLAARTENDGRETDSDQDLVRLMRRYQAGDSSAFESLYAELAPRLRSFLLHQTFDSSRVDDLLQETFYQVHRSRRTYVPPRSVRAWSYGIARHVFLMDRRTRSRRSGRESQQEEWIFDLPSPVTGLGLGDKDLLRRALTELSAERREILLMHHVHGLSFQEIGGILGLRQGTAKVRAHRAMNQLREITESLEAPRLARLETGAADG